MRHGDKTSRRLIKEQAPWFDPSKYDRLDGAPEGLWHRQFALRIDLHRMRSILGPSGLQLSAEYRAVLAGLTNVIREKGVIEDTDLKLFRQGEELLAPESFSVLNAVSMEGLHVRSMTVGDHLRLQLSLRHDAWMQAHSDHARDSYGLRHRSEPTIHHKDILSTPLLHHVHPSSIDASEAFLRIDLRLPRTLIKKQVEELVDRLTTRAEGHLPTMKQTKLPAKDSWMASRVLPYIDLCHWLDEQPNHALRNKVSDVDRAEALGIDPHRFKDTTLGQAHELTDPLSWTFLHLVEATISSRRGPLTPLRNTKRKRTGEERN